MSATRRPHNQTNMKLMDEIIDEPTYLCHFSHQSQYTPKRTFSRASNSMLSATHDRVDPMEAE